MITRELLVALRTDLTQVVYAWLSEREIKAYACGYGKPASEFPLWQRRDDGICRGTGSESSSVQTVHQQIRFGHESGMRLYRCTLPGGDSPGGAWGACLFEYGLSVSDF